MLISIIIESPIIYIIIGNVGLFLLSAFDTAICYLMLNHLFSFYGIKEEAAHDFIDEEEGQDYSLTVILNLDSSVQSQNLIHGYISMYYIHGYSIWKHYTRV